MVLFPVGVKYSEDNEMFCNRSCKKSSNEVSTIWSEKNAQVLSELYGGS